MSIHELPTHPNLEHLKKQARTLLRQRFDTNPDAIARFEKFGIVSEQPKRADALHVIAREHGFETWPALKLHIESMSEDPIAALSAAVRANSAQLLREVLARHPSLRAQLDEPLPNVWFDTPALVAAARRENRELIDVLLDAGANINARSRWWAGGFGVLDFAAPDLASYLISRGAIVDIHAASRLGMLDRVKEFLATDPQLVHARGGDGQFPLHFASTIEIAALLLDSGAEIDARDIDHESTALQYMVSIQPYRHEVAKYLVSRGAQADIFSASAIGDIALVESILNDDPDTVRATISERHFPKRDPRSGGSIYIYGFGITKSPHIIAKQFGHTKVFDLLMQRSAPWLRLLNAAESGDEPLARQIVERHPALFARLGRNALRIVGAAVRNNTRALELLLSYGWPCDVALDNNQTPLHYAAWHGNLDMVRALLNRNVPVNIFESEHGGSPLAWALHGSLHSWARDKGDYVSVTKALLDAGAEIPKPDRPLEAADDVLELLSQRAS